jgi:uncharacterized membrane protein
MHRLFDGRYFVRLFVFAWFFIGGIMHFAKPDLFLQIVPPYIPYALAAVYVSGAFELLGAIGLWIKKFRSVAGYGLMLLTVAVTPANVYMLQHANLFPNVPLWALIVRLPFQLFLIWLIWLVSNQKVFKSKVHT